MKVKAIRVIIGVFICFPQICSSETVFRGTVVEFNTNNKLEKITVTVTRTDNNQNLAAPKLTDRDGAYEVTIESSPTKFNIKYDPPDTTKYDPAGRYQLLRVTSEMELDTIGLTNKQSGKKDTAEMEQNARNIHGYIMAGGSIDTAKKAFSDARNRFRPILYDPVADKFGIAETLAKKTPFGKKTPYGNHLGRGDSQSR